MGYTFEEEGTFSPPGENGLFIASVSVENRDGWPSQVASNWFRWFSFLGTAFARVGKLLGQKAAGAWSHLRPTGSLPDDLVNLISKVDRLCRIKDL